jgi:dynein heavy chain, axonemal
MRVFHDRCTTESDRKYLHNLLVDQFKTYGVKQEEIIDAERVIYGDFMQGRESESKNYSQITELNQLLDKMDSF